MKTACSTKKYAWDSWILIPSWPSQPSIPIIYANTKFKLEIIYLNYTGPQRGRTLKIMMITTT